MTEPTPARRVSTAARIRAFAVLDAATPVSERHLFAVIDAASCVLDHGRDYGGSEVARLVLEAVAAPAVALAALRALEGDDG